MASHNASRAAADGQRPLSVVTGTRRSARTTATRRGEPGQRSTRTGAGAEGGRGPRSSEVEDARFGPTPGRRTPPRAEWLGLVRRALKGTGTAAWLQVHEDLRWRIEGGQLLAGEALPSEEQMAEAYAVSKPTLRRALATLANAGLIATRHGVGNVVVERPSYHLIDADRPLEDVLAPPGSDQYVVVLSSGVLDESPRLARGAAPPPTAPQAPSFRGPVIEYTYLCYVDDQPWALTTARVPRRFSPIDWDGRDQGLLAHVQQASGAHASWDEVVCSALPADVDQARRLEVPVGSPLLSVALGYVDSKRHLVAHFAHFIRGDRAAYMAHAPRQLVPRRRAGSA